MSTSEQRLLWVDDDGPSRFLFTERILTSAGWQVEWAETGDEAILALKREFDNYHAILVDQMFGLNRSSPKDVWAGVRLLHWLRGRPQPEDAPQDRAWELATSENSPSPASSNACMLIVSAFHDEKVEAALLSLSPAPEILVKPVDRELLIRILKGKLGREDSNVG